MSLSFRIALAVAGCTAIALTFAVALPWLIDEAPLFGPYRVTTLLTLSVVVPIYVYALIRIAKWGVRQAARGEDHDIAAPAPLADLDAVA